MRLRSLLAIVAIANLIMIGGALSGWPRSFAAELPWLDPDWLQAHVGEGEGQIAPVVLQRARALYLKNVSEGRSQQSLLLRHGRHAPRRLGTPILHHLRSRPNVSCGSIRTWRRAQP